MKITTRDDSLKRAITALEIERSKLDSGEKFTREGLSCAIGICQRFLCLTCLGKGILINDPCPDCAIIDMKGDNG